MTAVLGRTRLNIYIEYAHAKQLRELSALKAVSKSAIVGSALASFLSPEGIDRREAALTRRLDRLANQFERLERDQTILVETLALFIRYELSVSAAIPDAQQEAVRAQGKARFEKFIEQLARHLQRGGSLVKALHQEIYPDESHHFQRDASDSLASSSLQDQEINS